VLIKRSKEGTPQASPAFSRNPKPLSLGGANKEYSSANRVAIRSQIATAYRPHPIGKLD
jgi:hypothetical protein